MTELSRDWQVLKKIQGYCDDIAFTHEEYQHDYDTFLKNPTYRNAIALCLLQIGELTKKLSTEFTSSHTNIPWSAIRGMRNIVAHEYGGIDIETMWETSEEDILELRDFCEAQTQTQDMEQNFPGMNMNGWS